MIVCRLVRTLTVGRSSAVALGSSASSLLVADVGLEAFLVSLVVDDLQTAVGKQHSVLTLGVLVLTPLLVAKVAAGLVVLHGVVELVVGGLLKGEERKERLYSVLTGLSAEERYPSWVTHVVVSPV